MILYSLGAGEGDGREQVLFVVKRVIYFIGKSDIGSFPSSIPEHEFSFVVRDPFKIIPIPYLSHSVVFIRNRGL